MRFDPTLYLIAGRAACGSRSLVDVVREAVAGGVTIVQLRDPGSSARQLVEDARNLIVELKPRGIPVIVNDRIDVALAAGADGVHLGQDDMLPSDARRLLGADAIIGLSVGSPAEFATSAHEISAVDYLGVGPVRTTTTKADAGMSIGAVGVAAVRGLTELPLVAIGGVDADIVRQLIEAGADGVAVVSAVCGAADPQAAAKRLRQETNAARRALS